MENTPVKSEEQPLVTSNSETATVAASDTDSTTANTDNNTTTTTTAAAAEDSIAAVTSSPTTADPNDFSTPFQQFHEAVLAAVNSNSLPNSFFAAAAAAQLASQNVSIHPQSFDQTNLDHAQVQVPAQPQAPLPSQTQQHTEKPAKRSTAISELDEVKRESIRASNRERKKKWRLHNEERNKDNDLRCRVNKRANKVFGPEDSPQKQAWVQEEFEKRRQKRMDKERRKHIVNNVLSVPGTAPTISTGSTAESTTSTASVTPQMEDNLAAQNLAQANQLASSFYLPHIDTEAAAKILGLSSDLHRQLLEQLNGNLMALSNGILQSTQAAAAAAAAENITQPMTTEQTSTSTDTTMSEIAVSTNTEDKPADASQLINTTQDTAVSSNASANELMSVDEQTTTEPSPEKAATPTAEGTTEGQSETGEAVEQSASTSTADNQDEDGTDDNNKEEKKSEYPMDAVLTLMQLNAGWRH